MANTFTLIDKVILGSTQTTVEFTGLGAYASNYTDLKVVASIRTAWGTDTNDQFRVKLNSATTNYTYQNLVGYGTGVEADKVSTTAIINPQTNSDASTSNTFASHEIYIPNFSSSNYKSISSDNVNEQNGNPAYASLYAGIWSDTSAITSITFLTFRGSGFLTNSSFYLYGIKNS